MAEAAKSNVADLAAWRPAADGARVRAYPPRSWPSQGQLTYTKELITVSLLLLALPWLVRTLVRDPSSVLQARGRAQVTKPV